MDTHPLLRSERDLVSSGQSKLNSNPGYSQTGLVLSVGESYKGTNTNKTPLFKRKFSDFDASRIRMLRRWGYKLEAIAAEYRVATRTAQKICCRGSYAHIPWWEEWQLVYQDGRMFP